MTTLSERLIADADEWEPATIDGARETRELLRESAARISELEAELAARLTARGLRFAGSQATSAAVPPTLG